MTQRETLLVSINALSFWGSFLTGKRHKFAGVRNTPGEFALFILRVRLGRCTSWALITI